MNAVRQVNAARVILALLLSCGLTIPHASAQLMHTPTKMPMAKPESVGMSTDGLSRIDEVMQAHIDAGRIQGAVTAVARRGKVVHFSTHGKMDVVKDRAMERDAIFYMASSTKPVIAVAAMTLIDEGLISPGDPVSKFIPEFADLKVAVLDGPTADAGTKQIKPKEKLKGKSKADFSKEVPKHRLVPLDTPVTIHHLLTHTSGLMSGGLGSKVNPVKRTSKDTLATYAARLAKVPLDFQPGTRWSYGNAGTHAVVPRIVEVASKTRFEDYLREQVLKPLEMNNSWFDLPSDMESKRVVLKGIKTKKPKGGMGLSSTAEDFLHFEQMLLNGGELFGRRVLSPASVKMMSSNQTGDLFSNGRKGQQGMGFGYTMSITLDPSAVSSHRGRGAFGWGGAGGTMSWADPENELVAVIMLQQSRGTMRRDFAKAIQDAIIDEPSGPVAR